MKRLVSIFPYFVRKLENSSLKPMVTWKYDYRKPVCYRLMTKIATPCYRGHRSNLEVRSNAYRILIIRALWYVATYLDYNIVAAQKKKYGLAPLIKEISGKSYTQTASQATVLKTPHATNYVCKIPFDPLFTRKCIIIIITCYKIIFRYPGPSPTKSRPPQTISTNGHNNIHTARNNTCQ
jgi:hypothetical protein